MLFVSGKLLRSEASNENLPCLYIIITICLYQYKLERMMLHLYQIKNETLVFDISDCISSLLNAFKRDYVRNEEKEKVGC